MKKIERYIKLDDLEEKIEQRTKMKLGKIVKLLRKEFYRREGKLGFTLPDGNTGTIRAVPLYSLEGLLYDIQKEIDYDN